MLRASGWGGSGMGERRAQQRLPPASDHHLGLLPHPAEDRRSVARSRAAFICIRAGRAMMAEPCRQALTVPVPGDGRRSHCRSKSRPGGPSSAAGCPPPLHRGLGRHPSRAGSPEPAIQCRRCRTPAPCAQGERKAASGQECTLVPAGGRWSRGRDGAAARDAAGLQGPWPGQVAQCHRGMSAPYHPPHQLLAQPSCRPSCCPPSALVSLTVFPRRGCIQHHLAGGGGVGWG